MLFRSVQTSDLAWADALGAADYKIGSDGKPVAPTTEAYARRDAVAAGDKAGAPYTALYTDGDTASKGTEHGDADNKAQMILIQQGKATSI